VSADSLPLRLGWGRIVVPEWLVLVALSLVVNLAGLGQTHFWDDDETYFAAVAREMHLRQDWVVPWFNGELFSHKPPMMFWLMAGAFRLLGVNEFAARLPAALFGVATVLLVWRLGSRLFGRAAGFWAGCVLATSLNYVVIARAAACDAELTFFCTLALAVYARWAWPGEVGDAPRRLSGVWPSRGVWGAVYACMGLAVLTKGPIGVLLPGSVLGLFLLGLPRAADPVVDATTVPSGVRGWLSRMGAWLGCLSPKAVALTAWRMHPVWALLMVLLVSGPWFVWVGLRTDGEFLRGFFGTHHFHRFTATMDNHAGPPWFYLAAICVGFFPWILLLRPALLELVAHWRRTTDERPALLLLGAWVAVWVGFFSLATTKFPHYVVPAYPALALAAGRFLSRGRGGGGGAPPPADDVEHAAAGGGGAAGGSPRAGTLPATGSPGPVVAGAGGADRRRAGVALGDAGGVASGLADVGGFHCRVPGVAVRGGGGANRPQPEHHRLDQAAARSGNRRAGSRGDVAFLPPRDGVLHGRADGRSPRRACRNNR
jgi:hypothetical protein